MMKTDNWLNIYQDQLLVSFYKKRGKAIAIPHIVNAIDRLIVNKQKGPIRILDIGCGKGDLLCVLSEICQKLNIGRKIELYGLDKEKHLLAMASSNPCINAKFFYKDITRIKASDFIVKFDLIIAVNTLHEVFSSFLGVGHDNFPDESFNATQKMMQNVIHELSESLSSWGSIIIYDGLAPDNPEEEISFKFVDQGLKSLLDRMAKENKIWKLKYRENGNIIHMSTRDFLRFISTFKYLNSELWEIEAEENYFYFTFQQFRNILRESGLKLNSVVKLSNDLDLWQNAVELQAGAEFPFKSCLMMASKQYLPEKII